MLKIKKARTAAILIFAALLTATVGLSYAAVKDDVARGVCEAAGRTNCDPNVAATNLNDTVAAIINILSIVVGVVAVVMIIIGGLRYITSAGNEQAVAGAKRTLLYAIVGLLVIALAQVIVQFVLQRTT